MNSTDKAPKTSTSAISVKASIIPTFMDIEEDRERTPERWWARRQRQSLTGL